MDSISRRRFLEQSLWTTAALTGAGIAQPAQARRRVGANDRVNIACIGVRSRGMDHVKGYLDLPEANVVAICDSDENVVGEAMKAVEKKYGAKPKYFQDLRKLLEDPGIDAVSIATPNHWHALAAIWAIQAGKDVYVEKPVSHNVSEGRRIVEAARKYNKICQTGTQIRSQKGSIDAIAYIHSGKIGKVTIARGLCYKPRKSIGMKADMPVPMGVDYDLWLGPAKARPFNPNRYHYEWHWNWDYGNGDLGNQGIHQMDVARWALNKPTLPNSVFGFGGRFGYVDDGDTPNTEVAVLDYGDCKLIFEVRGLKTDKLKGAGVGNIIYGTEGYVVFTGYSSAVAYDKSGNEIQKFEGGGDHYANFLSAVKSRKHTDLHADIEEGHLSSALCHLGNISYRLGSPLHGNAPARDVTNDRDVSETFARFAGHLKENSVDLQEATYRLGPKLKLDPKKESFLGNPQADAMLTREYRKPFVVPDKV